MSYELWAQKNLNSEILVFIRGWVSQEVGLKCASDRSNDRANNLLGDIFMNIKHYFKYNSSLYFK